MGKEPQSGDNALDQGPNSTDPPEPPKAIDERPQADRAAEEKEQRTAASGGTALSHLGVRPANPAQILTFP